MAFPLIPLLGLLFGGVALSGGKKKSRPPAKRCGPRELWGNYVPYSSGGYAGLARLEVEKYVNETIKLAQDMTMNWDSKTEALKDSGLGATGDLSEVVDLRLALAAAEKQYNEAEDYFFELIDSLRSACEAAGEEYCDAYWEDHPFFSNNKDIQAAEHAYRNSNMAISMLLKNVRMRAVSLAGATFRSMGCGTPPDLMKSDLMPRTILGDPSLWLMLILTQASSYYIGGPEVGFVYTSLLRDRYPEAMVTDYDFIDKINPWVEPINTEDIELNSATKWMFSVDQPRSRIHQFALEVGPLLSEIDTGSREIELLNSGLLADVFYIKEFGGTVDTKNWNSQRSWLIEDMFEPIDRAIGGDGTEISIGAEDLFNDRGRSATWRVIVAPGDFWEKHGYAIAEGLMAQGEDYETVALRILTGTHGDYPDEGYKELWEAYPAYELFFQRNPNATYDDYLNATETFWAEYPMVYYAMTNLMGLINTHFDTEDNFGDSFPSN